MQHKWRLIGAAAAAALAPIIALGAEKEVTLPVVPIREQAEAGGKDAPAAPQEQEKTAREAVLERHVLRAEPGVNQMLTVAVGHLNRIVTPFDRPRVRTTATGAETSVSGNVVYIAPGGEAPVSLFVTEQGDESQALSLTLVPRKIPPREVVVELDYAAGWQYRSVAAGKWERRHPYEETIAKALQATAKGQIPQGYSLTGIDTLPLPYCDQPGLSVQFRQALMGHSLRIAVGVATNVSGARLEIRETACMHDQHVAAVAAWPRIVLEPGEQTEIYAVLREPPPSERQVGRPSLLSTAQKTSVEPVTQQGGPWGVQVLASKDERRAREIVSRLRELGYPAEMRESADGTYFVRVSGYADRTAAGEAARSIQGLGYDDALVVTSKEGADEGMD